MSTTKYGSYMSTSGASNFIRPYITYTITSTNTSYTCTWTGGCNVKTNYHTNAKITLKSTATGMSSQSKTVDNKNWGGGNHSMLSGTYTWSRTTSAATKTIKLTMSTNVDSSSVSLSIIVAALPTVTITYNGNGGTYSGSSTTLYYGVAGNITSIVPTRPNYTFLGWSTSSTATSATYASGASITRTANLTLYAVWKLNYIAPTVNGEAILYRVADDAEDRSPSVTNSGTRAYIEFTTTKGLSVNDYLDTYSVYVNGVPLDGTVTTSLELINGETANTYWGYIGSSLDDLFNVSTRYSITINVSLLDGDGNERTISAGSFLSAEVYAMDVSADGKRVAFGQMASDSVEVDTSVSGRWYAAHPRTITSTTLGYNSSTSSAQYVELNQYQDFSQNFIMRADFKAETASVRYCLISAFSTTSPQYPCINVELTTDLKLRLYCMNNSGTPTEKTLGTAISTSEEDMSTVVILWNASESKITWTLISGDNHETGSFIPEGAFSGTSPYPVRLGCDSRVGGNPAWGLSTRMDQPAIWYSKLPSTYAYLCYWDVTAYDENDIPYDVDDVMCIYAPNGTSSREFSVEIPDCIYGIDYMSNLYGMIGFERENTPGLWIGRKNDYAKAMHGHLVISTGWTTNDTTHTDGYGYMAPMVSVPTKYDTNGLESGGVGYPILHAGNLVTREFTLATARSIAKSTNGSVSGSVAKSGYTPLGIVGVIFENGSSGTYSSWVFSYLWRINNNTAYVYYRNSSDTTTAIVDIKVRVLYKQSSNGLTYHSANSIGMVD